MAAYKPEDIHTLFAQALSSGDIDALMSLYHPDAISVQEQVIIGQAAIRAARAGYLARKPQFAIESRRVFQSGDTALLLSKWTIIETDDTGKTVEWVVHPINVARRQPDGTWVVVIDKASGVE